MASDFGYGWPTNLRSSISACCIAQTPAVPSGSLSSPPWCGCRVPYRAADAPVVGVAADSRRFRISSSDSWAPSIGVGRARRDEAPSSASMSSMSVSCSRAKSSLIVPLEPKWSSSPRAWTGRPGNGAFVGCRCSDDVPVPGVGGDESRDACELDRDAVL